MTWALIDDEMAFNPKVLEAGNGAFGAWVRLLCWTRRTKTNGRLPANIVRSVASKGEVEKLVAAKLLDRAGDDFEIHDFLGHNFSAEELEMRRSQRAVSRVEKAKRAASARWNKPVLTEPERAPSGPQASPEHARSMHQASQDDAPSIARASPKHASKQCSRMPPPIPPIPPIPPSEVHPGSLVPPLHPESRLGGPAGAVTVTERVVEELGRSLRTRTLATSAWASELVLLAGCVRPDDLCEAIRKCVVGAPDGLTEAALKQRIVGFVANARNIEALRRARVDDTQEPAKSRPSGYIPLGRRPDVPPPPPRFAVEASAVGAEEVRAAFGPRAALAAGAES